ncbi:hypothetical protein C1707_21320 [Caulobacter flavus]|nr:hypothetical protein C1707_21320 [Caulobacter flavus]
MNSRRVQKFVGRPSATVTATPVIEVRTPRVWARLKFDGADANQSLARLDSLFPDSISTVGLDHRECIRVLVQSRKMGSSLDPLQLSRLKNQILRPCPQAVMIGFASITDPSKLDMSKAAEVTSALCGRRVGPAKSRMTAISADHRIKTLFPPPSISSRWPAFLREEADNFAPGFCRAMFYYASTILHHPFEDGNGRLARLIATSSLIKDGSIKNPTLPLTYILIMECRMDASLLIQLSEDGDWDGYISSMSRTIENYAEEFSKSKSLGVLKNVP